MDRLSAFCSPDSCFRETLLSVSTRFHYQGIGNFKQFSFAEKHIPYAADDPIESVVLEWASEADAECAGGRDETQGPVYDKREQIFRSSAAEHSDTHQQGNRCCAQEILRREYWK